MNEDEFRNAFRHTPFWRARLVGLQRNALIAITNQRSSNAIAWLLKFLNHPEPDLRIVAAWAIGEIGGSCELNNLKERLGTESEPNVRQELQMAMDQILAGSRASS
jgi:epoxyqueuosine reductase